MARLAVAAATVSLLTGLTACSSGSQSTSPDGGTGNGTLHWFKGEDLAAFDPATDAGGNGPDWELFNEVYDTLVDVDDHFRIVPRLATSWTHPSPTDYVFTLRKGVAFSNGRAMTADDVVGSLRRIADPDVGSAWASQLMIKSVTAEGPNTVHLVMTGPKADELAALAGPMAAILPMKELAAKTFDPNKQLLGTGPYAVKDHVKDTSWTFARNPHYWGTPAKAATLSIKVVPEAAARIAALRDGSADVSTFANPDSAALLEGQADVTTKVQETTDYYRIDVNGKTSIFRDARLRQALALSVDRAAIIKTGLGGLGEPSAAVAPSFDACDAGSVPYATPDAAKARALVAAAGATGKTVTILAVNTGDPFAAIAQVLQQNLQAAGLKVKIEQPAVGTWIKRVFGPKPDFDLSLSYYGGSGDAAMVLPYYDLTTSDFSAAYVNDDPAVDRAVAASVSSPPGAARDTAIAAACRAIASDASTIPLVTRATIVAYRSDRITAAVQDVEGYELPLRHIASFTLK